MAPFFLSYGLIGAAYIGTDAVTAPTMHAVKLVVYGGAAALTLVAIDRGVAIGLIMIAERTWVSTSSTDCLRACFPLLVEVVLVGSGLQLLVAS